MGFIGETLDSFKPAQLRQALSRAISLGMIVTLALMIWKGFMYFTGSESPVVVVLSGSMEPGFKRGDILFLHMKKDPLRTGDIVVFNIDDLLSAASSKALKTETIAGTEGRDIPIVHRVIEVHEHCSTGEVDILTKGDNNDIDDRIMYAHGQHWLEQQHIMGRAVGYLPYVGYLTIIMTEKPIIKYILLGALGLFALTSKE